MMSIHIPAPFRGGGGGGGGGELCKAIDSSSFFDLSVTVRMRRRSLPGDMVYPPLMSVQATQISRAHDQCAHKLGGLVAAGRRGAGPLAAGPS